MLMVACPTPSCGKKLQIPDELLGKMVRCSACQAVIQTRAPAPATPATPAPIPAVVPQRPAVTMPQMELDDAPVETPVQKPAPRKPVPVEEEIPELSFADIVEVLDVVLAEPGPRRSERPPPSRREPEPSGGDPFAFDSGADAPGERPRRRAVAGAAVGWLRAGAILHFLAVLLFPFFAVLTGAPPAYAAGVCVGTIPYLIQSVILALGAQGLDRLKWKGMVITAIVFAFIGFVLCLLLLGLAFIVLVVLLERNLPAFESFYWFVRFLLIAGLALCNLMAGIKTVAALANKSVQEAYESRGGRLRAQLRREESWDNRRDRDRDEDDDRPRRHRRDDD